MVERKLTGAHYGLRDWAMQRATAVIMLIYTVALLVILFTLPKEYSAWQAFFDQVWVKVFTQNGQMSLKSRSTPRQEPYLNPWGLPPRI